MSVQVRDETGAGVEGSVFEPVTETMARVESLLLESLSAGEAFIAEPALHLLNSGGKRFRPLVTVLGARFGADPDGPAVLAAAAAVEMIHLATLHHDDVMDESAVRRGVPTVNARWSNTIAILSGDYLLARAGHLLLDHAEERTVLAKMHETVTALVTGQMREATRADSCYDAQIYLRTIREKTAALISLAAWAGATLARTPPEIAAVLEEAGDRLGMVFQIADDILDLTVPTDRLGKTQGLDLCEGVATLPVIYALDENTAAARELAALLAEPVEDAETLARALDSIRRTDGLPRAAATMAQYVEQAHRLLDGLPASPARAAWGRLIDFAAARTH
ncbi:polyprenyl synthetase family protein [Nocardia sp. NPDC004068]|uniref:polyprenyl synthetase family protein n=1 Tax=Nocardia sp. NPDC004068 TaxID=3364303 RepID=UPI0036B57ED6